MLLECRFVKKVGSVFGFHKSTSGSTEESSLIETDVLSLTEVPSVSAALLSANFFLKKSVCLFIYTCVGNDLTGIKPVDVSKGSFSVELSVPNEYSLESELKLYLFKRNILFVCTCRKKVSSMK